MSTKLSGSLKILLTGGRAPVTLELARVFRRAGYNVYIAESLSNHLCRFSTKVKRNFSVPQPNRDSEGYRDALIKIMNSEDIDWLVPTCEEIFQIARWKGEIEANCRGKVYCTDFNTLNSLHNKYTFIRQLETYGLKAPETFLIYSKAELIECQRQLKAPSVIKPVFSRFGTQVRYLPIKPKQLPEIDISMKKPWVLQQRIFGVQFCTYSILRQGKLTAHTTYRMGTNLKGGASISFEAVNHPTIVDFVLHFSKAARFSGQIAFDIIQDPSGTLYPIECNPRATSGVHLLADQPFFTEAFFGIPDSLVLPHPGAKGMLFFPMLYSGVKSLSDLRALKQWFTNFKSSRDVIWDQSDPIPFFHQLTIPLSLWLISRRNKISLVEASTSDIEWNGES
ncbi:MAG: carbamoylphosphate synthase large subunit [Firmicutes bacterium]|nr:carbamoylphosphate synthase large subunit [Bacillota bacterium]